jgi:hypothetical protein
LPREDADPLARFVVLVRPRERLDFAAVFFLREAFVVRVLAREDLPLRAVPEDFLLRLFVDFFATARAFLTTFFIAFFGERLIGREPAVALAASAPITPPTTAPTGPATLPTAAPATAPAVSRRIGGI